MGWLTRKLLWLVGSLVKLPFYALYKLLALAFSKKRKFRSDYVYKKSKTGYYTYEHRQIAEFILKRKLLSWEVVHHINGVKRDNRPNNLCVMTRTQHERYHAWYLWIHKTYGRYPNRPTQLRKLRGAFEGVILSEFEDRNSGTG
ncbi:MAG: HNH endonuclease [Proteobacteria bacterium]|nr:MAG: HNH endonuclease [Pseudomonadota bacterium]